MYFVLQVTWYFVCRPRLLGRCSIIPQPSKKKSLIRQRKNRNGPVENTGGELFIHLPQHLAGHNLRCFLHLLPIMPLWAFPLLAELILLLQNIKRMCNVSRRLVWVFLVPQAPWADSRDSGLGLFTLTFSTPEPDSGKGLLSRQSLECGSAVPSHELAACSLSLADPFLWIILATGWPGG